VDDADAEHAALAAGGTIGRAGRRRRSVHADRFCTRRAARIAARIAVGAVRERGDLLPSREQPAPWAAQPGGVTAAIHHPLGSTPICNYTVTLVPGRYEVYYQFGHGGAVVPVNANAKLRCFDVAP
jgi:hypothetical protein